MIRKNQKVIDQKFANLKERIEAKTEVLRVAVKDNFGWDSKNLDYGHIGSLAHYLEELEQITDQIEKIGEFAPNQ